MTKGTTKKREPMRFAPSEPAAATTAEVSVAEPEPMVKVGYTIPKRLYKRLSVEAARREMRKQDLVREIFDAYFMGRDEPT